MEWRSPVIGKGGIQQKSCRQRNRATGDEKRWPNSSQLKRDGRIGKRCIVKKKSKVKRGTGGGIGKHK